MRYLCFLCILLWISETFASQCGVDPRGMQNAIEGDTIDELLKNTVNISGIVVDPYVNYQESRACSINGPSPKCGPIEILSKERTPELGDTTIIRTGSVAVLRNLKMDYENSSAMIKAVDSSWIIYPYELELQVGDSIYIKNYSAVYYFLSSYNCDYPTITATGEYFVNPTEDILATPRSRVLKVEKPKIHNRDAGGRCVNDKKRNVIKY